MKYFLIALVAALLVVTAIDQLFSPRGKPALEPEPVLPDTRVTGVRADGFFLARLCTVEHDGHRLIVLEGNGSAVLHHPDCPCGKLEKP